MRAKRVTWLVVSGLVLSACQATGGLADLDIGDSLAGPLRPEGLPTGVVTHVHDGDTVTISQNGTDRKSVV